MNKDSGSMMDIFGGEGPVFEAASAAFSSLFEGQGTVKRIIDGTRDSLVSSRGMSREEATGVVHATRNIFFDGMAAPGSNPVTDPTVKAALWAFPYMAEYLVDWLGFGTGDYDPSEAASAATRFREYMAGSPSEEDFRSGEAFRSFGKKHSLGYVDPDGYSVIRIGTPEELDRYADRWRLDKWCITGPNSRWDSYMSGGNTFYLVTRKGVDPAHSDDDMCVLGITIDPEGKVAYAFDRANTAVDMQFARTLADCLGIAVPKVTRDNLLERLKAGDCELEDLVDVEWSAGDCKAVSVDGSEAIVRESRGGPYFVTDWYSSVREFGIDGRFAVLGGRKLFDIYHERDLYEAPAVYRISRDSFLDDAMSVVGLCRGDGTATVNFSPVSGKGAFLRHDAKSDIREASYCTAPLTPGKAPAEPADDGYYEVTCADGHAYAVTSRMSTLEECPGTQVRAGLYGLLGDGSAVVSRDGGKWIEWASGDRPASGPFRNVDGTGTPGEVAVQTPDGKWESLSV